jgi:hypothetical protein
MAEAEGPADAAKQSLDQAANDPTASLMAVQFQNVYAGAYHNLADETGNTVLLRPVIPFKPGDLSHITRATMNLTVKFLFPI